ncbi:Sperm-associated antigen 17, partial [Orchesella cincta]
MDDTPIKGPRSYVLLQGFYNPRIIDELRKIGVIVDGILLMTDESVTKYNFSIIDVEDSIPGTFRPRNVLPQYLKVMERLTLDPEAQGANVTKFWATLSEMYNAAPPESSFHDIALMNFKLPEENKQYLDSPDGLTFYVSKVFDEVAKRVYEMLVLEEWFHEFTSAADVTQLQPLEPVLPRDIYEQIVDNVPAECMSVTILLEAVVQQVTHTLDQESGLAPPPPCYEEDILAGLKMGKSTFGKTDWGIIAKPDDSTSKKRKSDKADESGDGKGTTPLKSQPLFKSPMYIKSGDYASIRSCHLNESMAAKIASCQLSGDIRNIQGFLWNNVPDFNRGLYMKLLGNLNHFMYFLPPDMIQFEDMFYILHLLMSAGVEVHIQKEAETRQRKSLTDIAKPSDILVSDEVYFQNRDETEGKFPGTNLDMDHNYLAVSQKTGLHFVISPNSSHELTIASFGHTNTEPTPGVERSSLPYTEIDMQNFFKQTTELAQEAIQSAAATKQKKTKKKKSKHKKVAAPQKPTLDTTKVARITANNAIESAVEYAQTQEEYKDKVETEVVENGVMQEHVGESPVQSPTDTVEGKRGTLTGSEKKASVGSRGDRPEVQVHKTKSVWEKAPIKDVENSISGDGKNKGDGASQPNGKEKRFIACEEQWFDDIHDKS